MEKYKKAMRKNGPRIQDILCIVLYSLGTSISPCHFRFFSLKKKSGKRISMRRDKRISPPKKSTGMDPRLLSLRPEANRTTRMGSGFSRLYGATVIGAYVKALITSPLSVRIPSDNKFPFKRRLFDPSKSLKESS